MQQIDDQPGRIEAALVGACVGEAEADVAAGAADLLGVAESLAATGGFDPDDLRRRGLERPSKSGSAGLLLRGLPFGLLTPFDRPRLRRDAYRCVSLAGADEVTAISAVAVAVLSADLPRFDLATSLVRLRQSLLEDAPLALLDAFRVPPDGEVAAGAQDPADVLQTVIAALDRASGIDSVVRETVRVAPVAAGLSGALAGVRDGLSDVDPSRLHQVPHAETAAAIARRLAEQSRAALPAAGEA